MVTGLVCPSALFCPPFHSAKIALTNGVQGQNCLGQLGIGIYPFSLGGISSSYSNGNSNSNISWRKGEVAVQTRCLIHGLGGAGFWDWDGHDADENSNSNNSSPVNNHFNFTKGGSAKGDSLLLSLIQEIEPLDISLIQKDVSADTVDAMKRTVSGILGVLPSDQFHVLIEAFWEPLSRLLVSSMMTGYTLRNAEFRLCLQKSFEISENSSQDRKEQEASSSVDSAEALFDKSHGDLDFMEENKRPFEMEASIEGDAAVKELDIPKGLGELSPEAQDYIRYLQSQLSEVTNELQESQLKSAALQMQNLIGEEKNDLLDFLRSLEPEKVAELSETTSSEVQEVIQRVIHGLLATLSPKMQSKTPPQFENGVSGVKRSLDEEDGAEIIENASLQFQPLVSVTRDYLARLLFWCMLLGHYMRGLEYRLELSRMLSLSGDIAYGASDGTI
uniref:TSA: Wollemia nobilis Ref_Wollemi_Transcript_18968_1826 transcribed RNA sequence n=1 Tax=Wollemia nobilis TaxID=56998 RepID=A0A0C9S5J7_9CONI